MLESWTRKVIRARFLVISAWIILTILGLFAVPKLDNHLTTSLAVPSSESAHVDEILYSRFAENPEGSYVVLYKFTNASKAEIQEFEAKISVATSKIPTAKVMQQRAIGGVLFVNIGTSFTLTQAALHVDDLRRALDSEGLPSAFVTGPPAIFHDVTPILNSDLHRGQVVAVLLALLLLILLLGFSRAIFIPYIFAAATISVSLGIVFLLSRKILMVLYIPNILELIGLGLAIDYSLLIVHRFRQEIMSEPIPNLDDSITKTMQTAGRTVVISGLSVSLGLAALLFVPVPFIRSLGAAGLVVPLVSILAALTLQPALLSYLGRVGVSPIGFTGLMARRDVSTGIFSKFARFVIERPRQALLSSLAILLIAALPILWLHITPSSLTAMPSNLESARALTMVTDRIGHGVIAPSQIVIDLGRANQANLPQVESARKELAKQLLRDSEVFVVATDNRSPFVDATGRYLRMLVIGHHDLGAGASRKLVQDIREKYIPSATFPRSTRIYVGGAPAQGVDLLHRVFETFPWFVLLALFLAYLILVRAFRSVILPLVALVLDLISLAVAFGVQVWVFKFGLGASVLGTYRLDQIEVWVIVFSFAVLFGLSMDYEVFIVSRMREAKDRGASTAEAITEGLANTGAVVTAAAIILLGALSGFIIGHFVGLQQLGVGLAFGVLLDATLIRLFLLPSAMVLLGRWNWWLPETIARWVKTKASPLPPRSVGGERGKALEI
jgi:RND superfamily putative drug exporter